MSEQRWRTKQDGAELVTSYEPGTRRKRKGLWGGKGRGVAARKTEPCPSSAQTEAEPFVAFRYAVVAVRSSVGLRVW